MIHIRLSYLQQCNSASFRGDVEVGVLGEVSPASGFAAAHAPESRGGGQPAQLVVPRSLRRLFGHRAQGFRVNYCGVLLQL